MNDYASGNDFGHMESRDGDKTVGRYYVLLPDGRKQVRLTGNGVKGSLIDCVFAS